MSVNRAANKGGKGEFCWTLLPQGRANKCHVLITLIQFIIKMFKIIYGNTKKMFQMFELVLY